MRSRVRARGDTAGHACDTVERKATTQPGEAYDTAPGVPRHGAQRALCAPLRRSGCAAGFRVCTLCTQPSLDSGHCSESLFGSLFMNTIHEVFKKIK